MAEKAQADKAEKGQAEKKQPAQPAGWEIDREYHLQGGGPVRCKGKYQPANEHWLLELVAHGPGMVPAEGADAVLKAAAAKVATWWHQSDWVRDRLKEVRELEEARRPHALAQDEAVRRAEVAARARQDPELLRSPKLGVRLQELEGEASAARQLAEQSRAALSAIDARLAAIRKVLEEERGNMANRALAELRNELAAEHAAAAARILAAAGKELTAVCGVIARILAAAGEVAGQVAAAARAAEDETTAATKA